MQYILEWNDYYRPGDIILISYWYNGMPTPVEIKKIEGNRFVVSHKNPESKIQNAPDEKIWKKDIITKSKYVRLKS